MLALTGANRYYFVEGVTDMRLGQYRLCKVVETLLHREKFGIRLNFQMMDDANWGLARLDYNSNHKNPDVLTD